MLLWLIPLAITLLLIVLLLFLTLIGTIYITHPFGYSSVSSGRRAVHYSSEDEFAKVVRRLILGDVFDSLWVSRTDDEYSGLMLTLESGTPELSVSFKTQSEQELLASFRHAMSPLGFQATEDSEGFNGGFGEEFRVTMLEYKLPSDPDAVALAVRTALGNLQPDKPEGYFISASRFADGPGVRSGFRFFFRRRGDPLDEVL